MLLSEGSDVLTDAEDVGSVLDSCKGLPFLRLTELSVELAGLQ